MVPPGLAHGRGPLGLAAAGRGLGRDRAVLVPLAAARDGVAAVRLPAAEEEARVLGAGVAGPRRVGVDLGRVREGRRAGALGPAEAAP